MLILITLLAALLAPHLFAQNWPSFRGQGAAGLGDGLNPPAGWNVESGDGVLWKTPIPGLSHASPVIWGDRVFILTAISSDPNSVFRHGLYGAGEPAEDVSLHIWRVYCLNRNTGRILWERVAHEGAPRTKRHPKSTFASATPATDGRYLVAGFGSEGLYCYRMDGTLAWKQDLGIIDAGAFDVPDFQWGTASSPIIWNDLVIVQSDQQKGSYIAAIHLASGKRAWRTPREAKPSWSTPTVIGDELVTNGTEHVRGYDARTGKETWAIHGTSMISNPTPFAAGGLIYVASGYRRFIQPIYAINPDRMAGSPGASRPARPTSPPPSSSATTSTSAPPMASSPATTPKQASRSISGASAKAEPSAPPPSPPMAASISQAKTGTSTS